MNTITYSLKAGNKNSDKYYRDISDFTDKILLQLASSAEGEGRFEIYPILDEYICFIKSYSLEILRTKEEYFFDLVNLCTLLRLHSGKASNLKNYQYLILHHLYRLRSENKSLKPPVDFVRGILSTVFLTKDHAHHILKENILIRLYRKLNSKNTKPNSLTRIDSLIKWLEASGEYKEEVKRFILVYAFLSTLNEGKINYFLNEYLEFSTWFENEAEINLGSYTGNVNAYLKENARLHRWKEDVLFCSREKAEYYLSMFGAELMNRAFKKDFSNSKRKALLLPACMKLLAENKCKAKKVQLDSICTGCSPNCRINRMRLKGIDEGFEVHIIPHSSDFTAWLKKWAVGNEIGVIGVACPLNLITGGLELKSLEIPSQCVLLDYCGCRNHWHKNGISTNLNANYLDKILAQPEKVNAETIK